MRPNLILSVIVFLAACSSKENSGTSNSYFEIREYFQKEASRLQKQGPIIEKTAIQNKQAETKRMKLADWKAELELFTESDINKPAWRDRYKTIKTGASIDYLALDSNLRTRKISIKLATTGTLKQISILNKSSNLLYTSSEELNYIPDSIYWIEKHQNVRISGATSYSVEGRFKTNESNK